MTRCDDPSPPFPWVDAIGSACIIVIVVAIVSGALWNPADAHGKLPPLLFPIEAYAAWYAVRNSSGR